MPCWYFDKSDLKRTPSILDGVPPETEARYRREGPRFIFDMGTRLGLHHDTIATAVVFFHRFYVFHSFKKFPRYITATCCLFLSGKVEETPKKCRDLVKVARSLLSDAQFVQFGDDPREEVMTFERILLQTIKFDLQVEHPYKYMVQYAKALKGDRAKIENLVQMAWTFINDSLCTSLCLQWEPQIVAVAVMYLAGRLCKFEPQDWAYNRGRWWEQFIDDISMDLLEDICHQVLDLYSHQKAKSSSKSKRERPKTPGDGDKSMEPQAKTSRQDSKHSKSNEAKTKSSSQPSTSQAKTSHSQQNVPSTSGQSSSKRLSSSQPIPTTTTTPVSEAIRHDSTNREVVEMDTVETAGRGTIETNPPTTKPSTSGTTPAKRQPSTDQSTYYSNVNQYQSYMGASGEIPALTMVQPPPTRQYSHNYPPPPIPFPSQPSTGYGSVPTTPQTPTAPPPHHSGYSAAPPPQPYTSYSQPGFDHPPPGYPPRYPPAVPPNYGQPPPSFPPSQHYSGSRPPGPPGLATVRITGRRDQQGSNQWA